MNVDTLLHQYFPVADSVCIEMFDEKNIQQVYRRLVEVLIHQPEVETSLLLLPWLIIEQTLLKNSTNCFWKMIPD